MPCDVYFDLGKLQRPNQKDHKGRVFDPADPDFLVVDHITIARALPLFSFLAVGIMFANLLSKAGADRTLRDFSLKRWYSFLTFI